MSHAARAVTLLMSLGLVLIGPGSGVGSPSVEAWEETRFQTGCDPGPFHTPPPPEHLETHFPPLAEQATPISLQVDLGAPAASDGASILGAGFNFEHALWSCPEFRSLLRSEILDPFMPAIARVDTGLLPAAPPQLPAQELGPDVYQ
jgi:hypothetical protein